MSEQLVTPAQILERIRDSPYAPLLHEDAERTLIGLMAGSAHPVLAEMGLALERGELDWRGLSDVGAYREVLRAGLAAMREIDLTQVAAELDRHLPRRP